VSTQTTVKIVAWSGDSSQLALRLGMAEGELLKKLRRLDQRQNKSRVSAGGRHTR
jgi:hypothetical protein